MFCDELKLKLIAGKGGDGAATFRREKYVARGGPDGGDGGKGGDIIFKVNNNLNTLTHLANQKIYHAQDGENGQKKKMYGKKGQNLILEVPKGTIIFTAEKKAVIADLNQENNEIILAKGGKGGWGNCHFVSSTHQAPKFAEKGEPGEEKEIYLELKLVADVGIIGLPSAGKSTLISVISNAKPKIADYPFTTLIPNLGLVNMQRFGGSNTSSFVVADIPGLIEGAHEGKGLGDKFLRHISRTKLLIHMIDGYLENADKNYKVIRDELKAFDKKLLKLNEIIVINKIDLLSPEILKKHLSEIKKIAKRKKIFVVSALTKIGLKPLIFEVLGELEKLKLQKSKPAKKQNAIPILRPHLDQIKFAVTKITKKKEYKIYKIIGKKIEQVAVMTDISNPEGLERMYHYIDKMGIRKAVEKKGATFGDYYKILETKIPYRK